MTKQNLRLIKMGLWGLLAALLWAGGNVGPVLAHGEATLTVTPAVVAAGAEITVKGEGVEAGETFTLTLEGLNFKTTLGTVTVGDDEDFHEDFVVPADTPPGTHQVRAASAEGEVLTAELSVTAGQAASPQAATLEPSAELMELERPRPAGQLVVLIGGLAVSAALGLWLVRNVV